MTGNKLKILACLFMLLDHIGYLLLPQIIFFRYIGRLALPLFSYLIAEGCLYTKNKLRYFLSLFILAILCQGAFFIEMAINGGIKEFYFNILFTLSFSVIICYVFLRFRFNLENKLNKSATINGLILALIILFIVFITEILPTLVNTYLYFDYGISGVLLPLFCILFKDKRLRLISAFLGITLLNLLTYKILYYTWFSYLSLIFIWLYNGKRGKRGVKYLFYAFYPLHLAVIYLIQFLIV